MVQKDAVQHICWIGDVYEYDLEKDAEQFGEKDTEHLKHDHATLTWKDVEKLRKRCSRKKMSPKESKRWDTMNPEDPWDKRRYTRDLTKNYYKKL